MGLAHVSGMPALALCCKPWDLDMATPLHCITDLQRRICGAEAKPSAVSLAGLSTS